MRSPASTNRSVSSASSSNTDSVRSCPVSSRPVLLRPRSTAVKAPRAIRRRPAPVPSALCVVARSAHDKLLEVAHARAPVALPVRDEELLAEEAPLHQRRNQRNVLLPHVGLALGVDLHAHEPQHVGQIGLHDRERRGRHLRHGAERARTRKLSSCVAFGGGSNEGGGGAAAGSWRASLVA